MSILSSLRDIATELSMILEFNHHLIAHGWISHPWINSTIATQAVEAARHRNWQAADEALVKAYSPDDVRFFIRTKMQNLRAFKPRTELALLALEDYEAERFHACIPVTLALLDGMGKDELGQNILRHGVQLAKVADSFLEIGPGLTELLKLFCSSRNKTSTSPIDIPYRHGIAHGIELGYANRTVAAKAWGALIAFGSYAQIRAKTMSTEEKPTTPSSLAEVVSGALESKRRQASLEEQLSALRPRNSDDVIAMIAAGTLPPEAPEETVRKVMEAWSAKKPGIIAKYVINWKNEDFNFLAGRIRTNLRISNDQNGVPPPHAEIVYTRDVTVSHTVVGVRIFWEDLAEIQAELHLSYYANGENCPRIVPGGKWLVADAWPLESAVLSYLTSQRPNDQ